MFKKIRSDIRVIIERDPAARNVLEVIFCYPGFHAIFFYRFSNWLWRHNFFLPGRIVSHIGRFFTGIEIHPGARIGGGFFIDHGMGVVIGETAEIGENCTIYQDVTLGGISIRKEKRHPTLKDNVVVGAGAKILGPVTVGSNSRIGAGSVVLDEIPPNSTVIGVPGRVVYTADISADRGADIDWKYISDPVARAIKCMLDKISSLEKEIRGLREEIERRRRDIEKGLS